MSMYAHNVWLGEVRRMGIRYGGKPLATACDEYVRDFKKTYPSSVSEQRSDYSLTMSFSVRSACLSEGPKLFAPSLDQCQALAQIELNFEWEFFRQPFTFFSVVFPQGVHPKIKDGKGLYWEIQLVSACHNPEIQSFCYEVTLLSDAEGCMSLLMSIPDGVGYGNLKDEHKMVEWCVNTNATDSAEFMEGDKEGLQIALRNALRMYMNACQILTQCGMRKVGYTDPKAAAKLQWKIDNNPRAMRRAAQRELDKLPTIYGFDQHIRLFDTEGPLGQHQDGDGVRTLHPHWRRGHWRNQPYGPRNELRKFMFVRPCFVNPHLFAGDKFDTRVSMSVADDVAIG